MTHELAYKPVSELAEDTSAPVAGDFFVRLDSSAGGHGEVKKVDALDEIAMLGPRTELLTSAETLTAADAGKTFVLNSATAFAVTLPVLQVGLRFKFYAGAAAVTGGNHTIVAADAATIHGQCTVAGALVAAADEDQINLIADKFIQGDWVEVFCDGVGWYVSGQVVTSAGCTFTT